MITIRLEGGLGNIMFQYAFGKHLSIKNNTPLKFDIESFKTNPLGDYSLSLEAFNINIQDNIISDEELRYFKKYKRKSGKFWYIRNKIFADDNIYVKERFFHFDPDKLYVKDNTYVEGWWQTEKYFLDIREELLKDFSLSAPISEKNKSIAKEITNTKSVSVHIRRCDYVTNPKTKSWHGSLSSKYYDNAIAEIRKNSGQSTLFIFSDDIPWVKNNIKFDAKTKYIDWNMKDPHNDIYLMSLCKNNIIANSTLGWWGAWLNQNKTKIVVAPDKWFLNSPKNNDKDIIPKSWIKIPSIFEL